MHNRKYLSVPVRRILLFIMELPLNTQKKTHGSVIPVMNLSGLIKPCFGGISNLCKLKTMVGK